MVNVLHFTIWSIWSILDFEVFDSDSFHAGRMTLMIVLTINNQQSTIDKRVIRIAQPRQRLILIYSRGTREAFEKCDRSELRSAK
jgi:hypothetical protein